MTTESGQARPDAGTSGNEVSGCVTGPVVQVGTVHGGVHIGTGPDRAVPRQLPSAPRRFTGRFVELAGMSAAVDAVAITGGTMVVSAIGGLGGIGKTWLVLHWAHGNVDRFPDGQLFVDLRGFSPAGEPVRPAEALRGFLDALGVPAAEVPVDSDALVGRYRSLVAGKRMLIVLDNAYDTAQVAALLPGSTTCTVLVTSRRYLPGLVANHSARTLELGVLTDQESHELLEKHLGGVRLGAEPDAAAELVACCAGLPLALGIVAARASRQPTFPLAVLAEELRDVATRLDGLDADEIPVNLRAVFSWSHHALSPEATALFGLLGLAPGPDIGLRAVLSLAGSPAARSWLRELESAYLVVQRVPGRYRMHDLLRLHAIEQASPGGDAELRRLVDFYLHSAFAGERVLDPPRVPIELDPPVAGVDPHPSTDQQAALRWFDAEHPCLLAAQHFAEGKGWHDAVWQLAWVTDTYHWRRGHVHEQLAAWLLGLEASHRGGDSGALLRAHRRLGYAWSRVGRHGDALRHLESALAVACETGDRLNQARTHHALAVAWGRQSEDRRALEHATAALRLFEDLDHPIGQADMLNAVGWHLTRLGDHDNALDHCERALVLHRGHAYRQGEAYTLTSLGNLARHRGDHLEGLALHGQALTLFRAIGHTYQEANALDQLAQAHVALGDRAEARRTWDQALLLCRSHGRVEDADRIQRHLDHLDGAG